MSHSCWSLASCKWGNLIDGRDLEEGQCLDSWSRDIEISAWSIMTKVPSHQACTRYLCFYPS